MQIIRFGSDRASPVSLYNSAGVSSVHLASGSGDAHVYSMHFEPGGAIGEHPTGFGQLLLVIEGSGWVAGSDGTRVQVTAGEGAYFACGEFHSKGSDAGMTAIMVQIGDLVPTPDAT